MAANDPNNPVTFKTVDLSAEIRKIWGPEWGKPTPEYEFSNGATFSRRTQDCAVYETSPDH